MNSHPFFCIMKHEVLGLSGRTGTMKRKTGTIVIISGLIALALGFCVEVILLTFRPDNVDPSLPRQMNGLNILLVFLISWPVLFTLLGVRHGIIPLRNEKWKRILAPGSILKHLPTGVIREEKAFLIIALVAGFFILFLTPPLTAPDEQAHFTCVWPIGQGQLLAQPDENGSCYRTYPAEWSDFLGEYPGRLIGMENTEKFSFDDIRKAAALTPETEETCRSYVAGVSLGYGFSALGMGIFSALGRWIGIPLFNSVYFQIQIGRLFNLLFYVFVIYRAIRRTPHFRRTMLMLSCMPMTLYLACSLSYDAIMIPVVFYYIALILSLCTEPEKKLTGGEIARVFLCVFMLTAVKYAYAPLLAMLLAVPRKKYGSAGRLVLCIGGAVIAGALGFLPTILQNSLSAGMDAEARAATAAGQQSLWLREHPDRIPWLFWNTLQVRGASWVISFWGCLGWLDVHIPYYFISIGVFGIFVTALYEGCSWRGWAGQRWKNILPFAGVVISLTGIALTMYIEHTTLFYPVGGDLIEGIQGRYFIPCFLPMVLALSNNRLNKFESMKKETAGQGMSLMAVIWSVGCALVTIGTLLFRYWI